VIIGIPDSNTKPRRCSSLDHTAVCHNADQTLYSVSHSAKEDAIATTTDSIQEASGVAVDDDGQFQAGQVATIGLGHASHDLYPSFLAPLLPLFIANLALSKTEAGLLTLFLQGSSVVQPALGHLADRWNLRRLVVIAPTLTALLMCAIGLAPNYGILALLLVLTGISSTAFHAIAPALAGSLSGKRHLGRGMSLWMLGGEVGFAVGPLLIVTWVNWLGLKGMPWLALIGVLGSILLLVRLRDVPRTAAPSAQGVPWWRAVSQMGPVMLPLLGLIVARSFALSALSSYLPTFLSEGGTSFWLAGASLTVYQVAASGGVLLGGSLSDRLGRRAILLASMALSPLFLFAFLRLGGAPQIASLLGIGFGVAFFDPVVLALVQETFTQNRALASSVYLSLMFVVRSFATVAVGAVGDWLGLRWAFTASAIVFLLGAPLVFWLPRASVAGQTASESGSRP